MRGIKPFFELVLTKRGKRSGITDKDGKLTHTMNLRHAEGRILWESNDENVMTAFSLKDLQKMIDMPPTAHSSDMNQSALVRYVATKLGLGLHSASEVVAHLMRLSASNPIIIWNQRTTTWSGVQYGKEPDPF